MIILPTRLKKVKKANRPLSILITPGEQERCGMPGNFWVIAINQKTKIHFHFKKARNFCRFFYHLTPISITFNKFFYEKITAFFTARFFDEFFC